MKKLLPLVILFSVTFTAFANVSLPKIFGNNMVLQRNKTIPVWGWADANEKITVSFNKQTKTVTADNSGNWKISLDKTSAGGPYELIIKGKNTVTFNNVLVGEVWICSGQSNMEMPIEGWGKINNYQQEIADANYPQIRHIKVPNTISAKPEKDIKDADWEVCSPETAGDFTAVGYFFARELYSKLKVPIGLINTSWGGTHVETWTSRKAFENSDEFKSMIATLPPLDLDSLSKIRKEKMMQSLKSIQSEIPDEVTAAAWKNTDADDSKWQKIKLPGLWEKQLPDMDGVVWFRKTINISAADAGKAATLELAMIDDNDITYINGMQVGSTKGYNTPRSYSIPAGVLKEGKNAIAVRVEDTGGGGGIYGDGNNMKLTIGSDAQSLTGDWAFQIESLASSVTSIGPNSYPSLLFNAMVNPLIPYAIEGVIWYQGEANAGRAYQYRKAFPLMINDWRQQWNQGNFPFYFVQLSAFNEGNGDSKNGSTWAELREAQTKTLSLPNTGMAVTTDIGNATDIHPKNKQDVGLRLAAIALHNVYSKNVVYSGPMYQSMKTEGNKILLTFGQIGGGLMAKNGELKGFEIAGEDKQFHTAKAEIEGNNVVVQSDGVNNPVSVHYAWADYPGDANLFNKEGFPAVPFRTDSWKGITEEQKFTIGQ